MLALCLDAFALRLPFHGVYIISHASHLLAGGRTHAVS
jgi:hypothetical protein